MQPIKLYSIKTSGTLKSNASGIANSELSANSPRCLKFSIKEGKSEDWDFKISLLTEFSTPCTEEINYIYRTSCIFESLLSYFETTTHGCCIPEYTFSKGLLILLTYLDSNNFETASIKHLPKLPFMNIISNHDNIEDIISSFNRICEFISNNQRIQEIDKAISSVKSFLSNLIISCIKDGNNNSRTINRILKKTLVLAAETKTEINKISSEIEKISKSYDVVKRNIKHKLDLINGYYIEDISMLVHFLYPKWQNNQALISKLSFIIK